MKNLYLLFIGLILFAGCDYNYLDISKTYNLRDRGPAGGWIFYINPNYKTDGWKYLEAATVSNEYMNIQSGTYSGIATGITDSKVGAGKSNTLKIVAWLNNNSDDTWGDVTNRTNRAAYICYNLEVVNNGISYKDWFLPSKDELSLMYNNLHLAGIGNFETSIQRVYWTSTEDTNTNAYQQWFGSGPGSYTIIKTNNGRVRAIRRF